MAEEAHVIRGINWRETFPFINIFRAFRVAIHPSKLFLALAALLLLYFGGRVLDAVWPASDLAIVDPSRHEEGVRGKEDRRLSTDEVSAFEGYQRGSAPTYFDGRTFSEGRAKWRQDIEKRYADNFLLKPVGDATDPIYKADQSDDALSDAHHANHLGDVKNLLVQQQEDRLRRLDTYYERKIAAEKARRGDYESAESARKSAMEAASKQPDEALRAKARKDADDNFQTAAKKAGDAVRKNLTDQADKDYKAAKESADKITDEKAKKQAIAAADKDRSISEAVAASIRDDQKPADAIKETDEQYQSKKRDAYAETTGTYQQAALVKGQGIFAQFFFYEVEQINGVVYGVIENNWLGAFNDTATPRGVVRSAINFLTVGPRWLMQQHPVYFVLFTLLFLIVWALFGGAIARIAAVHVARDEKLSVRQALRFSASKILSFIFAPLIPLAIVLVVGFIVMLGGLVGNIPWIGPVLVGLLFFLALGAGFVMTLVLLGTAGGFNLMYPTIAVEGSDSFDAISRSFSYVYARPWRMLFYTILAVIYGALTYLFVHLFIVLMLSLTHYFVGTGFFVNARNGHSAWETMWPLSAGRLSYETDFLPLRWDQALGAGLVSFWVYLTISILGAFAISFYFSSNTIIYYLMRREVDATEMDDVYLEQADEEFTDPATDAGPAGAALPTTATHTPADGTAATAGGPSGGGNSAPAAPTPAAEHAHDHAASSGTIIVTPSTPTTADNAPPTAPTDATQSSGQAPPQS